MADLTENVEHWLGEAPLDKPFARGVRRRLVTTLLVGERVPVIEHGEQPALTDADVRRLNEAYLAALRIHRAEGSDTVTITLYVLWNDGQVALKAALHCAGTEGEPIRWETELLGMAMYDGPLPQFRTGPATHGQAAAALSELARIYRGDSVPQQAV